MFDDMCALLIIRHYVRRINNNYGIMDNNYGCNYVIILQFLKVTTLLLQLLDSHARRN